MKLLREQPLPLDELVETITRDASLMSRVIRAATAGHPAITPDLGTAIVLLGAARLRALIAHAGAAHAPVLSEAEGTSPVRRGRKQQSARLRLLKKAIAAEQYRINPMAIAQAMLRNLERS